MADLDKYATMRDLAAVSGFAAPTYTVGPAASGAAFTTVQEAADEAAEDIVAGAITRALVLVHPGTYAENVICRCDEIHFAALGGLGSVIVRSLTITDATLASLTTFNGTGTFTDLAVDAALTRPPLMNSVERILLQGASVGWVGNAIASLRLLGADVAAGTFFGTGFLAKDCRIEADPAAAAGTGAYVACYANDIAFEDCIVNDGCVSEQVAKEIWYKCITTSAGNVKRTYNSAGVIPITVAEPLDLRECEITGELELNGDTCDAEGKNCYIGSIDDNATAAGSASTFEDCHIAGAIDNANVNATILITGGEVHVAPSGAGAASVTVANRRVHSDTVPLSDNTRDVGTTALAMAEVHARSVQAHADATDTAKTALTATALTATGNAFTVAPATAAVDVAGYAEIVRGGQGGVASAAAGGAGGTGTFNGGAGGAGTAALAAGAGGDSKVTGGAAGANNGGGGANGGHAVVDGGAASEAGTAGIVKLGTNKASAVQIGNAVDNPPVDILGTGTTTHRGHVQPNLDNSVALGAFNKSYTNAHARSVEVHADATNTDKTTILAASITATIAHAIAPTAAAADTAGKQETITAGAGGVASAVAGGVGGLARCDGGAGGAGTAALAAGAGGAVGIAGGAAGANNGGGGAAGGVLAIAGGAGTGALAGGALTLAGGAAPGAGAGGAVQLTGGTSGAGTAGKVQVQPTGAGTTEIGNAGSNPATSFLGTGTVAVGGDLDCAGRVMGREVVRVPAGYPYAVLADDRNILATAGAGGVAVNLPSAVAGNVGEVHYVVHYDAGAGAVAVTPQGGQTINSLGAGVADSLAAQWDDGEYIVAAANQWVKRTP